MGVRFSLLVSPTSLLCSSDFGICGTCGTLDGVESFSQWLDPALETFVPLFVDTP